MSTNYIYIWIFIRTVIRTCPRYCNFTFLPNGSKWRGVREGCFANRGKIIFQWPEQVCMILCVMFTHLLSWAWAWTSRNSKCTVWRGTSSWCLPSCTPSCPTRSRSRSWWRSTSTSSSVWVWVWRTPPCRCGTRSGTRSWSRCGRRTPASWAPGAAGWRARSPDMVAPRTSSCPTATTGTPGRWAASSGCRTSTWTCWSSSRAAYGNRGPSGLGPGNLKNTKQSNLCIIMGMTMGIAV